MLQVIGKVSATEKMPSTIDNFIDRICNRLLLNILQVISQKYGLNL